MRAIPKAARAAVAPALVRAAEDVADIMRKLAPDDPKTGAPDLKTSIVVTGPGETTPPYSQPGGATVVPENAAVITAGNPKVRYAHLQEYGTTRHNPQAFFWPGFRLGRDEAMKRIKRAIGKAIKEAK
jgi:HK97 gp10 family phage protein